MSVPVGGTVVDDTLATLCVSLERAGVVVCAFRGVGDRAEPLGATDRAASAVVARAWRDAEARRTLVTRREPRWSALVEGASGLGLAWILCEPMFDPTNDEVVGAIAAAGEADDDVEVMIPAVIRIARAGASILWAHGMRENVWRVVHGMNNDLAVVKTNVELVREELAGHQGLEESRRALEHVLEASKRFQARVETLVSKRP